MLSLRRAQRKTARRFLGKAQLTKYFNRANARQFLARFFCVSFKNAKLVRVWLS